MDYRGIEMQEAEARDRYMALQAQLAESQRHRAGLEAALREVINRLNGWTLVDVLTQCREILINHGSALAEYDQRKDAEIAQLRARIAELEGAIEPPRDERYYSQNGSLKWGYPVNVAHLILQLQALDPEMGVSSVTFIDTAQGRKARAYGLSMSRERWDGGGWLDFKLPGPECLAVWATPLDASVECQALAARDARMKREGAAEWIEQACKDRQHGGRCISIEADHGLYKVAIGLAETVRKSGTIRLSVIEAGRLLAEAAQLREQAKP